MYLTAHRVRSKEGQEGINAWMHVHGSIPWPTGVREILGLVENAPGDLVDQACDLKPGGNSVLAYLDILAPDDTPRPDLIEAIDHLYQVEPAAAPIAMQVGPIVLRMSLCRGRMKLWSQDVEELSRAVENLMRRSLRLKAGRPAASPASVSR